MTTRLFGSGIRRREDPRLITGGSTYTDDIRLPGMVYAAILRSPHGHNHGLQCGFCTAGMIMTVVDLLQKNPHPSSQEVRDGLEGNICRCTGYHNIVKATLAAADAMGG